MAASKTSLSAGLLVRAVLLNDPEVSALTTRIFPVVTADDTLPYIQIRRRTMGETQMKTRSPIAGEVELELACFTGDYDQGVELAEAVRYALDNVQASYGDMYMRSCYLVDSEETFTDDAFVQLLAFRIKI